MRLQKKVVEAMIRVEKALRPFIQLIQ